MKCCRPIISTIEFELGNNNLIDTENSSIKLDIFPVSDIEDLKAKVICEYLKIISNLELGKYTDLEFILEEISLIDLESEIENREFILLNYLNNIL